MHVGWFETMLTPFDVIAMDLEFDSMENEYLQSKTENTPKRKRQGMSNGAIG